MLLPDCVFSITESPYILIKVWVPSTLFGFFCTQIPKKRLVIFTVGKFLPFLISAKLLNVRNPNEIIVLSYSFSASNMHLSTDLDIKNLVNDGFLLASIGITPNRRIMGHES